MSLILYEPVVERVLRARALFFIELRGNEVAEQARQNASGPIIGIRSHDLINGIGLQIEERPGGPVGLVGTPAAHPWKGHDDFHYPTFHDENGRPWLFDAAKTLEQHPGWIVSREILP